MKRDEAKKKVDEAFGGLPDRAMVTVGDREIVRDNDINESTMPNDDRTIGDRFREGE